jgi:signal transduction histidine kinase
MRKVLFFLFSIYFFLNGFGQDYHRVDSLTKLLYATGNPATGAVIFWLAYEYMWTKPDTCLYYTKIGFELIGDPSIKDQFEKSERKSSLEVTEDEPQDLPTFEMDMYWISAVALSELRNDSLAVRMGLKALQLAERSKGEEKIRLVYAHLSEVYQNIGEPEIAIDYIRKYLSLDSSAERRLVWTASMATCFYDAGEYDSALFYLNKIGPTLKLGEAYWPVPPHYLGKIYARKGNYNQALIYYKTAMTYSEQGHYVKDLCDAYLGLSESFAGLGMTDSALFYGRRSLVLANDLSLPGQSLNASIFLTSIYESKGLIDSAFKYQKISGVLKDSLYNKEKIKQVQNYTFDEKLRQQEISEKQRAYRNKLKTYALAAGLVALLIIAGILLRNNRHKQKLNNILQGQKKEIQNTLAELRTTQAQLIQSEKMASLGELTAGIAHEIQNPLNFVNNFSEVNNELVDELKSQRSKVKGERSEEAEDEILNDIKNNTEKIIHHGKRADAIVKGMLQHSRTSSGQRELTDINALCDEYLRLAYHGSRAKDPRDSANKNFNAEIKTDFDASIGKINIVPQEIGRVILNLINNAFYAVSEQAKLQATSYEPLVAVRTKRRNNQIEITVEDNGNGIPRNIADKIFQPFFTTKPTGQGTGLGLSLSYDIVKAHGGELNVKTRESEGSEFIILLPIV